MQVGCTFAVAEIFEVGVLVVFATTNGAFDIAAGSEPTPLHRVDGFALYALHAPSANAGLINEKGQARRLALSRICVGYGSAVRIRELNPVSLSLNQSVYQSR